MNANNNFIIYNPFYLRLIFLLMLFLIKKLSFPNWLISFLGSGKTVTISLWNDLATTTGQELLDMVDSSPVVAIKSLKVSDFQGMPSLISVQSSSWKSVSYWKCVVINCGAEICLAGVSLSTIGKSTLAINPDLPEAQNLKSWYYRSPDWSELAVWF